MAQRTVALCNGKYIGIETIYTVINGQQINIPEKLKELREKSHNNELFCPCGCGTNLILVAGDKNLREQHFRKKTGTGEYECSMPTEGKISVDSKIILKCWLDDKLKSNDIESRVPIVTVEDTKGRMEFTFLSRSKKLAIRYWRTRANIVDNKLDVLTGNLSGIDVIYIVDSSNGGSDGQYPEALMRLQDKQGYCLLLHIEDSDYTKAELSAIFYEKDIDGLWTENEFASDRLARVDLIENQMFFNGTSIKDLLENAKKQFADKQIVEKERRLQEEQLREERYKKLLEEQEKKRQELERQREENEKLLQKQREEAENRRRELEEKRRLEEEKREQEKRQREEDFQRNKESNFAQQETQVRDAEGNRWIKCEFCGKIAKESEFTSYGGAGHINLGTCKNCSNNNSTVKEKAVQEIVMQRKKYELTICPDCGGKLREQSGPYGRFYGCMNYPKCRYSRSIKK